jgi:hypothetical protein
VRLELEDGECIHLDRVELPAEIAALLDSN